MSTTTPIELEIGATYQVVQYYHGLFPWLGWLFEVQEQDGDQVTFLVAYLSSTCDEEGLFGQDLCVATEVVTTMMTDASFTLHLADSEFFYCSQVPTWISDPIISGTFSDDLGNIDEVSISYSFDTSQLVPYVDSDAEADLVCQIQESFGEQCMPCKAGCCDNCLVVSSENGTAPRVYDTIVENPTPVQCWDPISHYTYTAPIDTSPP